MTRFATTAALALIAIAAIASADTASARGGATSIKTWTPNSAGPANAPSSNSGTVVRDHGTKPIVRDHRGQKYTCINGKCGWVTPHH